MPPSDHALGVYAHTDSGRGVFKAPANETLRGVLALENEGLPLAVVVDDVDVLVRHRRHEPSVRHRRPRDDRVHARLLVHGPNRRIVVRGRRCPGVREHGRRLQPGLGHPGAHELTRRTREHAVLRARGQELALAVVALARLELDRRRRREHGGCDQALVHFLDRDRQVLGDAEGGEARDLAVGLWVGPLHLLERDALDLGPGPVVARAPERVAGVQALDGVVDDLATGDGDLDRLRVLVRLVEVAAPRRGSARGRALTRGRALLSTLREAYFAYLAGGLGLGGGGEAFGDGVVLLLPITKPRL